MIIKGIWLPDYWLDPKLKILKQLKAEGFNGILIRTNWHDDDTFYSYLNRMIKNCEYSFQAGFEFVMIDFMQGLGARGIEKNNPNYNYQKVEDYFFNVLLIGLAKRIHVCYYLGEPVESWYEKKLLTYEELIDALKERAWLVNNLIFIDATKRNIPKIYELFKDVLYNPISSDNDTNLFIACSSYFNQHKLWGKYTNAIWIYGQLKFGGSLRYKYLSKIANQNNIQVRFLYQGDPGKFSIKEPYTWLNSLLQLLGLRRAFESWQRRRFIKHFS